MRIWKRTWVAHLRIKVILSGAKCSNFTFAATANSPDVPRRLSHAFPSPVFFEVILSWLPAAARREYKQTDKPIQNGVDKYATSILC